MAAVEQVTVGTGLKGSERFRVGTGLEGPEPVPCSRHGSDTVPTRVFAPRDRSLVQKDLKKLFNRDVVYLSI